MKKDTNILNIRKDRRVNFTHVGASLPSRVSNYLTLYALANKITKSKIVGELVNEWIRKEEKKGSTTEHLLDEIIHECIAKWKIKFAKHGNRVSIEKYRQDLNEELTFKGVSEEHIAHILSAIK